MSTWLLEKSSIILTLRTFVPYTRDCFPSSKFSRFWNCWRHIIVSNQHLPCSSGCSFNCARLDFAEPPVRSCAGCQIASGFGLADVAKLASVSHVTPLPDRPCDIKITGTPHFGSFKSHESISLPWLGQRIASQSTRLLKESGECSPLPKMCGLTCFSLLGNDFVSELIFFFTTGTSSFATSWERLGRVSFSSPTSGERFSVTGESPQSKLQATNITPTNKSTFKRCIRCAIAVKISSWCNFRRLDVVCCRFCPMSKATKKELRCPLDILWPGSVTTSHYQFWKINCPDWLRLKLSIFFYLQLILEGHSCTSKKSLGPNSCSQHFPSVYTMMLCRNLSISVIYICVPLLSILAALSEDHQVYGWYETA